MLVMSAIVLLALAALHAGSGLLAWLLIWAAVAWGCVHLLALASEDARRFRDWWRGY